MQALGGAKNSMVVAATPTSTARVPAIMGSAFGAAGQRCLAGSVCVIVGDEARQDEVRDALRDAAEELVTGPGADAGTDVCPMVAPEARERAEAAVADGRVRRAARCCSTGGSAAARRARCSARPSSRSADPESELAREEIFGPVLALVGAPDLDAAIEFVNGSRYGNAGSIFTTSGAAARAYRWGDRGGDARRQHRRAGAGRLVPVLGLEGLHRRRPARQRPRRGRLLHAQEGRHRALVTSEAYRGSG